MLPNTVRKLVLVWFWLSILVFAVRATAIAARFRSNGQDLVDRELERLNPGVPEIDIPNDSPWPTTTISMNGRPISGMQREQIPWASISFAPNANQMTLTYDRVSLIDTAAATEVRKMPGRIDDERLWNGAISGDGSVIATVGEHTLIKFWDAQTGRLIQALEDEAPTFAAQLDRSEHSRKHTNKLRYSETGVRRIAAAPGGCLFAIGKIDGSIELWAPTAEPLPTKPSEMTQPQTKNRAASRFSRLTRTVPHDGEVLFLAFTRDCQSLISVSGLTVQTRVEANPLDARSPNDASHPLIRVAPTKNNGRVICTRVPSNEVVWSIPQGDTAAALAMDHQSQFLPLLGRHAEPPRFAIADFSREIAIRAINTGEVIHTINTRTQKVQGMINAISFGTSDSYLWVVSTGYVEAAPGKSNSQTRIAAWEIKRAKRIATAVLPGQVMAAEWGRYGSRLALLRFFPNTSASHSQIQMPWDLSPPSPFMFHLWNVELTQMSQPAQ